MPGRVTGEKASRVSMSCRLCASLLSKYGTGELMHGSFTEEVPTPRRYSFYGWGMVCRWFVRGGVQKLEGGK